MRMWGPIEVFDAREEEMIHRTAMRIMDEVGFLVESDELLAGFARAGAPADRQNMLVRFPARWMEKYLAECERFDWATIKPSAGGWAEMFHGRWLDPDRNRHVPWTVNRLMRHLKVARNLPHISGGFSLTFPIEDVPPAATPLYIHYLALKYDGRCGSHVAGPEWAPYVYEMCQAFATENDVAIDRLMGVSVFLTSPLKLARGEAEIYSWFMKKDIRVGVGRQCSAGGTAPVTLAGAMALHLAQALFCNIVSRVFFGLRYLSLDSSISPLDMRTGLYPCARPEQEMCNVAMAQLARRYGARYGGHCGHADAHRPGVEAGFQKAASCIPTFMACGRTNIVCGTLSGDAVFSPIQMIIDDEMVGFLQRFVRGFEVNEETLAFDVIKQVGPGGAFPGAEHTARHIRREMWEPRIFNRQAFDSWIRSGAKVDTDLALDIYHDILKRPPVHSHISAGLESELLDIIHRATGVKVAPAEAI